MEISEAWMVIYEHAIPDPESAGDKAETDIDGSPVVSEEMRTKFEAALSVVHSHFKTTGVIS